MWFTRVSINNPYFATIIMLAILLIGLIALNKIAVEEFPNIKFPIVIVNTEYKGASPSVVETDVTKPIEEALYTLNGIKTVRSYSFEARSWVIAEFNLDMNADIVLQDARDKIANVTPTFRKEIGIPVISKVNMQENPIMSIQFASNSLPVREITSWVNQVAKKRLQAIDGVGDISTVGGIDRQIRINLKPYQLQALNLSVNDVINAIKNADNNYPSGNIKTTYKNIDIRIQGKIIKPQDFANIVITYKNNTPIRISDVASVIDGQDEYNNMSIINGKIAVGLDIRQTSNANVVNVAQLVYQTIKQLNKTKPQNLDISISYDKTIAVKDSLHDIEKTLVEGAMFTILIVFIFLKSWRSTIITGLTLPIALIGTIFAIYMCGFTLNMMSLLALSLSIGLLIDDAIVVRENIVRHLHMGKNHMQAAMDGTQEIGLAVFATTLTLIAVFLPVGFMQGIIGRFFFQFGITVTVAVLISLLVSFTLDPMLSSIWHESINNQSKFSFIDRCLNKFEVFFEKIINYYEYIIRLALNYKKSTLLITLILLIISFMLVPLIGGEFMPQVDKGKFSIAFKTDVGSNIDFTASKAKQINHILKTQIKDIKNINISIAGSWGDSTNNAKLIIDVGNKAYRKHTIKEIMAQARSILDHIAGVEITSVAVLDAPGGDDMPININIKGDNIDKLNKIADDLLQKINKIAGVTDVSSSFQKGNPAFDINVNRDIASNLGINLADIGVTLSTLFAGNKVSTWEDATSGQNYDVVVQIPESQRDAHILDLLQLPSYINNNLDKNNAPSMVSLSTIASTQPNFSPRELDRYNLQRKVTLSGNIVINDNAKIFNTIGQIINNYNLPQGYEITQNGNNEDMQDSFFYAIFALLIGILFIYMILVAQFRSFILPLVIMVALPLSFIGVFIALLLFDSTINMFSIIGIIMLMGLSTKNGILLVDFINQELLRGVNQTEAIVNAGVVRLRPIVMTSLAMIFGMMPLAFSQGHSSEIRKPMAYAIIGGMTTSTILTLIVVPVIFVYCTSFSKYLTKKFNF